MMTMTQNRIPRLVRLLAIGTALVTIAAVPLVLAAGQQAGSQPQTRDETDKAKSEAEARRQDEAAKAEAARKAEARKPKRDKSGDRKDPERELEEEEDI